MLHLNTIDSLIKEVRPLDEHDLEALRLVTGGPPGITGSLRARHHKVAMLAAAGLYPEQIADTLSHDVDSINVLLASKSMQDLIAEYQQEGMHDAKALLARTKVAAASGLAELHKRLETPVGLDFKDVKDATFGLLDRSGVGPLTKHHVVSAGLSKEDLLAIITAQNDRTIDVHQVGSGATLLTESNDQAPEEGNLVREQAAEASEGSI